jgi:hypothetical protein
MNPEVTYAEAGVVSAHPEPCFSVRRSREIPTYHELSLEDPQGSFAHWVIPQPLKQVNKRPVLLWLLSVAPVLDAFSCVETGTMQLAAAQPGVHTTLRNELEHGVLRLNFNGHLLRGYYRLQCLPTGCGQLWQLTPIGHI